MHYQIPFGRNTYCGPAALAYVTRTDPDHAASALRKILKKKAIRAVPHTAMLEAIREHGRIPIRVFIAVHKWTLGQWLKACCPQTNEYLVWITNHYIVFHGDRWFDNGCHLGKPIEKCPDLRRRVRDAWLIQD